MRRSTSDEQPVRRARALAGAGLVVAAFVRCAPDMLVGAEPPAAPDAGRGPLVDAAVGPPGTTAADANMDDANMDDANSGLVPLEVPWSTGFENVDDWTEGGQGYCYSFNGGTYTRVTSPVHSGSYAAAFGVDTLSDAAESQARCIRNGVLPSSAYYGAWYFLPTPVPMSSGNWNLFHFQGANVPDGTFAHGLWDVSLFELPDGPHLGAFDFLRTVPVIPSGTPATKTGAWVHIEAYLHRASDATGEFAIYQDSQLVLDRKGMPSDDTAWGEWFVGDLADTLAPPGYTVFVDDVTISLTP